MIKSLKIFFLFSLIIVLSDCGFKPIYKTSENNLNNQTYSIVFKNDPGYLIKNKVLGIYGSTSTQSLYTINLSITQNSTPLITNTDGTVSKYRIEVMITFDVTESNNEIKLYTDISRGFAEYLVQTSEIETDEKLKQAIEIATNEAVQMMSIKIQSNILRAE